MSSVKLRPRSTAITTRQCRAGSSTVDHNRDTAAVAFSVNGSSVAWSALPRIELAAAQGARGVRGEPGVDAHDVERVAADGEQADGVELGQADGALGCRGRRLLEPHRGECGQDRGVQPGRLARRVQHRRVLGRWRGSRAGAQRG
jgi:hypothetical protein